MDLSFASKPIERMQFHDRNTNRIARRSGSKRFTIDDTARARIANDASETQRRLFRSVIDSEAASLAADLACLSSRFSFKDFPDFLVMACRGDLSDIAGPFVSWGLVGPDSLTIRHKHASLASSQRPPGVA